MGNEFARLKSGNGYFVVQTDKQFYFPGEMVSGSIYMRVTDPFQGRHVEMIVKGIEKTKWYDTTTE